jgi:flagellar basal body rod protein FlgG
MKIKCIDNKLCSNLTLAKEYNVIEEGDKYYIINDDKSSEIVTRKSRFEIVEDGEIAKKAKATITELTYQTSNDFKDIKDFKIRKNSKGEIKEILIKFKYE